MPDLINYRWHAQQLLPQGKLWDSLSQDPNFNALIDAFLVETMAIEQTGSQLLIDADPSTTTQLLPAWEYWLDLSADGLTQSQRREAVTAKYISTGGQSRGYMIEVAAALGYTIIIKETNAFRCGVGRCGDAMNGADWKYTWVVQCSVVDDLLMSTINKLAATHTIVRYEVI